MKFTIARVGVLTFWAALVMAAVSYLRIRFPSQTGQFFSGLTRPTLNLINMACGLEPVAYFPMGDAYAIGEAAGIYVMLALVLGVAIVSIRLTAFLWKR